MNRARFNFQRLGGLGSLALVVYDGADVHEALQGWWAARPDLQALTADGRFWHLEAPEDTALPYLTYFLVSEPEMEGRTTAYYFLNSTVQINAHAETDDQAEQLRNAVRDVLTQAPLAIDGNPVWYCLPSDEHLMIGEGRGPNGSDCWTATLDVDIPWQLDDAANTITITYTETPSGGLLIGGRGLVGGHTAGMDSFTLMGMI